MLHYTMELWNKKNISMPPNCSVKMKKVDIDVINLKSIVKGALIVMEEQHILHMEAALVSRLIFKLQRKFRGQKGLMCMYKVNRGLKRYMTLDLQHVYNNFCKTISCVNDNDEFVYVPTKQMLQYVLVRTQGFFKVMNYVSVACQDAALYFKGILQLGHLMNLCLLNLSLFSRIWFCTKYFMISACQWYDQLLPFLDKLKTKGPCWLTSEYEFTENLGSWLGSDPITGQPNYDVDVQKISQEISQIKAFQDFGTLISRKHFRNIKKKTADILHESVKPGFIKKDGKLLTSDFNAKLIVNGSSMTRKQPLENDIYDLNEQNSNDNLLIQDVENERPLLTKNVCSTRSVEDYFGEQISRDEFVAQKAKNGSISVTRAKFRDTSCDSKSNNLKPVLTTTLTDTEDIPGKSDRDNQILLLKSAGNNTDETQLFDNVISERKNNAELNNLKSKKFKTSNSSKTFVNTTKSCQVVAYKKRQTSLANKYSALTDAFCSLDPSPANENESFSNNYSNTKITDVYNKKESTDALFNDKQMENKFVQSSQIILNDNKDISCNFTFKLNTGQASDVSEDQKQCSINSGFKQKKKKSGGNWEIINGIKTIKDVKAFLHSEKHARTKGKSCVTSQLSNSEWIVLFESIKKMLKKKNVSELKGNKKVKSIMEEIRNTLISFVI